jgi:cytosine/adenosine deaminase-related metal-dependent hydrolase
VILFRSELLFPGDATLARDMDVVVDEAGVVVEVARRGTTRTPVALHRDVQVLLPGVINAHTHLTDAEIETPVPGGDGLNAWVRRLLAERLSRPAPSEATGQGEPRNDNGPKQSVSIPAVADVIRRMRDGGTAAVGEVCNGTATLESLLQSGMRARYVQEMLAFPEHAAESSLAKSLDVEQGARWNDTVRPTLGVHAPYSVSPKLALALRDHNRSRGRITYEHLAEDPAERELYETGTGPWRDYLDELGAWDPSWRPPGMSPIAYYESIGLLGPDFAAVHLADATADEIALVARRGVRVILSPISNWHIGRRVPPLEEIVRNGIPFALGTDGRGSNWSIDVFDEARELATRFEWLDGMVLLRALTTNGAATLGFDDMGRIAPGMRPAPMTAEIASLDGNPSEIVRRIILEPISRHCAPLD